MRILLTVVLLGLFAVGFVACDGGGEGGGISPGVNVNGFIAEDRIIQHGDIANNDLLGDVVRVGQLDTSNYFRLDFL